MTAIPLGKTSYYRRGSRTPEISLINMVMEADPTNQVTGVNFTQRPGLTRFAAVGAGPIRGVFRKVGVISSGYWVVSGHKLYSVNEAGAVSQIGTIPGDDIVSIDGSADRLIVVADGTAYSTDGVTIVTVAVPDIDSVPSEISSVVFLAGYFVLSVKDSQHFFWLAPGDVDPDALNFASAESAPDNIIGAARFLDDLWFFGEQTTQVFQLTGSTDAPFQPVPGRMYEKGSANRDTVAGVDNTLFWVSNEFIVYRADTSPVRISDHAIEERIRTAGATDMRAWVYYLDGHTFYCIRAEGVGTFVYDVENKNWSRFKTYNQETWRAHIGSQVDGQLVVAGDDTLGILWQLDLTASNDDGVVMEREVTGGIPVLAPSPCKDVTLTLATGWAPIIGTATNPKVFMRFSDDGGNVFSSWLERQMGLQGKYQTQVTWTQMGRMRPPGRIFHWRCTDDALFRLSYARANEFVAA